LKHLRDGYERINLLSSEIDANEDENGIMQDEINILYAKIDANKPPVEKINVFIMV
jgi:hypothetical protein